MRSVPVLGGRSGGSYHRHPLVERAIRNPQRIVTWVVVVLAFGLREAAAKFFSSPVDEAASVLAVQSTAHRGLPILPSGVPYLQGATLSYLLAPLQWLGLGGLDHLFLLRQLSVLAGVAVVAVTYVVASQLTAHRWLGVAAAFLMAVDPPSLAWSSTVRMYGLLQLLTVTLVWAAVELIRKPSIRAVAITVVVGWLTVFTTVLGGLLFPGVVAGPAIALARARAGRRHLVSLVAGLLAAPLVFVVLNHVLARGVAVSGGGSKVSAGFVGDHLISTTPDWTPTVGVWLARGPAIVLAVASLVLLACWLRRIRGGAERALLLLCYWVPVATLLVFGKGIVGRYFVYVRPLAMIILVLALADLMALRAARGRSVAERTTKVPAMSGILAVAVLITSSGAVVRGLTNLGTHRTRGTDLVNAARYVAAHHRPGETVLVNLPPPMYLELGSADDIVFVAGYTGSNRTKLYTRRTDHGLEDFWVGSRVITSNRQVCGMFIADPHAWLVTDTYRLQTAGSYLGPLADAMIGLTENEVTLPGGVLIRRAKPDVARVAASLPACGN
jgi:hypothetical protein